MRRDLLDMMAKVEDRHWWFVGRRALVADALSKLPLPDGADILDAGCGTGGNLATWARFGRLQAFEIDEGARDLANQRGITSVVAGHLPDGVPFEPQSFDVIVSTDVLEHVADDRASLAALHATLRPGGWLALTVPALPALWSPHDAAHGHHRRYRRAELLERVQAAGLVVERCTAWNGLLLPAAAAERAWARVAQREAAAPEVPASLVNRALKGVLWAERALLSRRDLPLGVSLLVVARRP